MCAVRALAWPGFACFFELVRRMCLRGCDVELEAGLIVCAGVGVSVVWFVVSVRYRGWECQLFKTLRFKLLFAFACCY